MTFEIADEESRERKIWRKRMSAEDPEHASHFCPEGDCGTYVGMAGMPRHREKAHPGSNLVGPEKTIRKGKAGNIDDERLSRRREYLSFHMGRGQTGNSDDSRLGFALKAGEMHQVENELQLRGLIKADQRKTKHTNPAQFGGM